MIEIRYITSATIELIKQKSKIKKISTLGNDSFNVMMEKREYLKYVNYLKERN